MRNTPLIALLLAATGCALAQPTDPSPQFEVAVIKPSPPRTTARLPRGCFGGPGTADPTRWTCTYTNISFLLFTAYQLKPYQFTPPAWTSATEPKITAKIPEGATKEQMPLMIRSLLAERFKLAAHFEKKEMPIYEMTVGLNGPKFRQWTLPPLPPDAPYPPRDAKAADFIAPLDTTSRDGQHDRRAKESMGALALYLSASANLGRPVIDETGLTADDYDTMLDWVQPPPLNSAADAPPVAPGPTLLKAVESQLGLKLESKKGMIDVLVIDHLEKTPTEN